jgi:hypothetical protein
MKKTSKFLIAAIGLTVLAACAPKDQQLRDKPTSTSIGVSTLSERDGAFAGYLVAHAFEARRALNTALGGPEERTGLSPAKAGGLQKGCRILKKNVSSAQAEKFSLLFAKGCVEANSQLSGARIGAEIYSLAYATALPTKDNPLAAGQAFPFPHTITVKSKGERLDLDLLAERPTDPKARAMSKLRIDIDFSLSASLVAEDERTATYDVTVGNVAFFESDFNASIARGKAEGELSAGTFIVDRATRRVTSFVPSRDTKMSLFFKSENGEKADGPKGKTITNRVSSSTDLEIVATEPISFAADDCTLTDARFTARRKGAEDRSVSMAAGKVALEDGAESKLRLCTESGLDPAYTPLVEGLFF